MNASDVLYLPSLSEGLPNVALEAMACSLSVVASRGGVPEIVQDGRNGLLVPSGDARALVEALRKALTTRWDKVPISRTVEQFDWNLGARTVMEHLERALST